MPRRDSSWPVSWAMVEGRLYVDVADLIAWLRGSGIRVTALQDRVNRIWASWPRQSSPPAPAAPIISIVRDDTVTANHPTAAAYPRRHGRRDPPRAVETRP